MHTGCGAWDALAGVGLDEEILRPEYRCKHCVRVGWGKIEAVEGRTARIATLTVAVNSEPHCLRISDGDWMVVIAPHDGERCPHVPENNPQIPATRL